MCFSHGRLNNRVTTPETMANIHVLCRKSRRTLHEELCLATILRYGYKQMLSLVQYLSIQNSKWVCHEKSQRKASLSSYHLCPQTLQLFLTIHISSCQPRQRHCVRGFNSMFLVNIHNLLGKEISSSSVYSERSTIISKVPTSKCPELPCPS